VEKDKQQLMIEIDSISTALESANKAKVRLLTVCFNAPFTLEINFEINFEIYVN